MKRTALILLAANIILLTVILFTGNKQPEPVVEVKTVYVADTTLSASIDSLTSSFKYYQEKQAESREKQQEYNEAVLEVIRFIAKNYYLTSWP